MSFKSLYKEVMREYDKNKIEAEQQLKEKINKIYNLIPEIYEIDNQLKKKGLNNLKYALNANIDVKKLIKEVKEDNTLLLKRKIELLLQHGFNEDYLNITYKCNLCNDTGYIMSNKCICLKQKLINKYYAISNLSDIIKEENFDTFDFRYYSDDEDEKEGISPYRNAQTIYGNCLDFIKNFDKKFINLLFYGNTGLGKTFLCNCIAKDLLDKGKSVLYVTAPRFFKKIEDKRFKKDDSEFFDDETEMIFECDVFILDDLGTEFSTIVTNTELFNIINTRILQKKPTIISSNLSLNEFQSHYSDRIVSRFFGNFKMMKLYGDDIRVKKKLRSMN